MTNRNDILNELNGLESDLSNINPQNIYAVPDGYFEGLANQVLNRIKALEATSAKDELEILSPLLSAVSKEIPFSVPAGYFEILSEKMMQGILISITGIEYRELAIRLNLMESHINFLNDKQVEMLVAIPIRELTLLDTLNKKKYHFIHSDFIKTYEKTEKGFYQVLQKGKACLYSFYKKTIKETRAFNAATFEQSIQTDVTHLVLLDGRWKKFNKIKSLPSLFSDKKNEVQKYIDKNDLSGYKQEDVELVIQYYNSLFENKL